MFSSLANRNFRVFFLAISFSVIGTFGQELAQAWLVLQLTHSAAALGIVAGLQFLPMLVLGPWGGVLTDRFNRRRILLITQSILGILALSLWALTVTNLIQVWMICVFALAIGITGALNTPTRLGFLHELVGEEDLHNAVSLNSTVYSTGRILGPALAGLLITLIGVAPVFLLNGLSFLGVIAALLAINTSELHLAAKAAKGSQQLRAGVRYIARTPVLAATITMTLITGIFTYEFPVTLPALAKLTFHGNASTLAILSSALGLGAVIGGLANARFKHRAPAALPGRVAILGVATTLIAIQPTLGLAAVLVCIAGFSSAWFSAFSNSVVQLTSLPEMRGRTLAIWTAAWVGSTAIGGPLIGWICQQANPRWALATGGILGLVAAVLGFVLMKKDGSQSLATN